MTAMKSRLPIGQIRIFIVVAAGSGQAMKAAKHFMQKSTVRLMLQGRNGKNENNITLSILSDATLILIQWII